MGNLWKVARAEYLRLAAKRSFILSLVGMPVFIGALIAIIVFTTIPRGDARPIGYVDLSGVLAGSPAAGFTQPSNVAAPVSFPDEEAARAALERGEIQAFYVLPADYLQTRSLRLYTGGASPEGDARNAFESYVSAHLIADAPVENQQILLGGTSLYFRALADGREFSESGFFIGAILPFIIGFFFVMIVMGSGGYLLQAVTTEKENRMVEVMITSISPLVLIGGKAIGLIAVALTQVLVWLATLVVALAVGSSQVTWLADMQIPWGTLGIAALFFLPTYVLLAGMMITVGSMVTELQHGQQIAGFFNLLFAVPFFFIMFIFTDPDNPIMVALTLFPTTSMMTLTMRWGVTSVPLWQIALSFVLLVGSALGSIWLAAKVFRMGMLQYGQPLTLGSIVKLFSPAARRSAPAAGRSQA